MFKCTHEKIVAQQMLTYIVSVGGGCARDFGKDVQGG